MCIKYAFSPLLPSQTPVSFYQKKSVKPDVDVKEIRAVEAEDLVRSLISVAYCLWLFM